MVRPILAAIALVQILSLAPLASAQTQAWDQAAATEAAGKLESAIVGLRDILQTSPQLQNPGTRRLMYEIMDNLRQMEFMSQTLHASLSKGAGLDETLPTYNKLQQERRYTEVLSKRVDISAITQPKLDEARTWLAKLEPYYPAQPGVQDVK